jgi:hypothetical protein
MAACLIPSAQFARPALPLMIGCATVVTARRNVLPLPDVGT